MEERLRHLLVESHGGFTRAQIVSAVNTRPRSNHRLAEDLDFADKTIRHHLNVLLENNVLQRGGDNYGAVYLLSEQARHHQELIEELTTHSD
jgi:predicted ArsR family transcriptional regulator